MISACGLVASVRRTTGVSSFFAQACIKGLDTEQAYFNFVNGLDFAGKKVSLGDYEERGEAIGAIIVERKKFEV